jgi:hypothetical protein
MSLKLANVRVDMLVTEPDESNLLVVETKRRKINQSMLRQIGESAAALRPAFVMVVDPHQIVVAPAPNGTADWDHSTKLSTPTILGHYDDTANFDRMEDFYFHSLVEAWLRDFTHGWKSATPPGYEELDEIGLAARLRGGEVHSESHL